MEASIGELLKYPVPMNTSQQREIFSRYSKIVSNKTRIDSEELVGIEVEVENVPDWQTSPIWFAKEDGSLRNDGVEYISCPVPGKHVPEVLNFLFEELLPPDCVFSPRTSIHVHLNVLDLTLEEVKYLTYLYIIFENSFYRFVDPGRRKNIFCVPLQETSLLKGIFWDNLSRFERVKWYKYTGYNLLPVRELGTVEFRHLNGTQDVNLIINWVSLIIKLKEYIKKCNLFDFDKSIRTLNTTSQYYNFVNEVFGEKAPLIFENPSYKVEMGRGISNLKTNILVSLFAYEVIEAIRNIKSDFSRQILVEEQKKFLSDLNIELEPWAPAATAAPSPAIHEIWEQLASSNIPTVTPSGEFTYFTTDVVSQGQ